MSKTKCPKCGKTIDDSFAFCNHCGAKTTDSHHSNSGGSSGIWALLLTLLVLAGVAAYLYRDHITTLLINKQIQEQALAVAPPPVSPDEARAIVISTLNDENRMGDRADIVYALEVPREMTGKAHKIIGLTALSNPSGRSFCKVYSFSEDSLGWHTDDCQNIYFEHQELITDPVAIMGDNSGSLPQILNIAGKNYFHFAYSALPMEIKNGSTGKVTFALLNIEHPSIIIDIDFEGEVVEREGAQAVTATISNGRQTPEGEFLAAQSRQAKILMRLTPEQLELEKPEHAIELWHSQNTENLSKLREGEPAVAMKAKMYDKPIFVSEDVVNGARLDMNSHIVVADGRGNVYAYRKSDKKYFVVFAPLTPLNLAAEIAPNADSTLHVALPTLEFDYDLNSFTAMQ